ncbi:FAD-dependent oxidoreductase [Thermodesulfobacteriota bacterium]
MFEPGKIGSLELKNRIIMASMANGLLDHDGNITQRTIDYYEARAKGGVGLIITGATLVSREIEYNPVIKGLWGMLDSDLYLDRYQQLAETVHKYGAKIAVQLLPACGYFAPPDVIKVTGAIGASAQPCMADPSIISREMTLEDIRNLAKAMAFSAKLVKEAGIDAIEINGHAGYILDEFMTPVWNERTDEYGGSLDNRVRFPLEVVRAIKEEVGKEFPVTYKYGLMHGIKGGRKIDEGLIIARMLEEAGIDALCIEAGCHLEPEISPPPTTMPPGLWVNLSEMTKKVVKIPVIAVGKLGYPELAEKVIKDGKADFIALGRALLADPSWPNKVKEGRTSDICPCVGDLEGCMRNLGRKKEIDCAVNPSIGREKELAINKAEKLKTVLVVGGGPAGMEASRVAALRGHKVILWEKNKHLGGNLLPASAHNLKNDYKSLTDYLSKQIEKLAVSIELGKEATVGLVIETNPDAVVIATGSEPVVPDIPGIKKAKVSLAVDILMNKKKAVGSVAIIGGGLVGCETAMYLVQQVNKITIIEMLDEVMADVGIQNRTHMMMLLADAKVDILTSTSGLEITDKGLTVRDRNGEEISLEADTVVLAAGFEPSRKLLEGLKNKVPEVYAIGDCVEPRMVINAIAEGYDIARRL